MIIIPISLLMLLILTFSFLAKREIIVKGTGIVVPKEKVSVIQPLSTIIIKKNYLNEGKLVHKQDTLFIYKDLNSSSKLQKITAPKSGIIHINENYKNLKYIPNGTQIAEIYPILKDENYVQIRSYISAADISSIKKGQQIKFKIACNVPKPIIITGTIKNISIAPITIDKNNVFGITSIAKISNLNSKLLKYGMVGSTSIIIGEKTFFNYYIDKLLNRM